MFARKGGRVSTGHLATTLDTAVNSLTRQQISWPIHRVSVGTSGRGRGRWQMAEWNAKEGERRNARWRGEEVEKRKRESKRGRSSLAVKISKRASCLTRQSRFPCAGNYERKIERARRGSHSEFTNRGNGTSTRCYVATRRHGARGAKGGECFGGCIPS